jgi:hypothetical protein
MNPIQRERNRRTALILASVAATLFVGYLLRYWLFK